MPITSAIHGWCVSSTIAIFFSFLPFICLLPFAAATDTLNSSQPLRDGETLVSANNLFELGFFSPGQSQNRYVGIGYTGFGLYSRVVWVANRESPLANFNGSLVIDNGGNLVVLDGSSNIQWSSSSPAANTATTVGFIAVLQDSGNLVLREGNSTYSGRVVWESFDDPTDTLLPGMKIGINLTTGKTQMLRSWKSDDDPAPGSFSFSIDPQAPNQFFVWRRSAPFWRVIFWNGNSFDSPPWMARRFNYSVTRKEEEIYFTYPFLPTPVREVMGLAVKSNGDLNTYSAKISGEETYNLDRSRPDPVCYPSGNCGPNSSCNENSNPICKCLPGFMPVSVTNWNSGNMQDGCTPRTKLQCGAQDGFLQLKRVKLVDPNNFASAAENATECRQFCNDIGCRCSAYAFKINGSSFSCSIWNSTSTLGTDDYQLNIREEDDDESPVLDVNVRVPASEFNLTGRRCESCGTNTIPYPLSTGPNCGDPAYNSFKCYDFGQLHFQGPNDSSFAITSINPETRTFVIKPEGVDLCWAGSSKRSDIHLNGSLPFHVSKNNTILLLNCSSTPKNLSPLNCESSSPCHIYIQKGRAPCFHSEMCCSHVARGSQSSTSHKVGVSDTGCNAYASIVNLNSSVEVSMWHEGVEIEWDGPSEPVCESSKDCDAWPNSSCLSDKEVVGRKRCFCNGNLQWDPLHMNCTHVSTEGSDRSGGKKGNKRLLIIITTTTAAIGILLSVSLIYCLWRRKNKRKGKKLWNMSLGRLGASFHGYEFLDRKNGLDIPFIDFKCIVEATENFSDSNKLGKGGFGPVYMGKLPGGQEIAVKRLSMNSGQGLEEFKNEVLLISKLQHMNLVKMLGYCIEGDEKMLIYEYMPNKSLDFFLFDPNRCALLDWKKRFNIILGIARGLLYLHQDSRLRIIHRDLKTSNILLDSEMNPKISDFGMARIFGRNQAEENTNRVVGTFGYISPEYAADGLFSVKSDVFSFGIVLLEIVCGKKNARYSNNEDTSSLTGHAWKLWKEEKGLDFMDPSLSDTYNPSEVLKCIHVGLLCVQENARDRPNMASVLNILDSETATLSSPKQPAFYISSIPTANSASNSQMSCSKNEVTISTLEGR